jgi:AraC-like DNA-binding protein
MLHSSLVATAIACCVLGALVAGSGQAQRGKRPYLVAFLLLEAVGFVLEWLMLHPTSPAKALWLGALMALSFLSAPCLWLYAIELTSGRTPSLRVVTQRQWSIIVLGVALTTPLIATMHAGTDYADPQAPIAPIAARIVSGAMLACALLFLGQVPAYLRACLGLVRRHEHHCRSQLSQVDPRRYDTLRSLMLLALGNWLVSALRIAHCMVLGRDAGLGILMSTLDVAVVAWAMVSLLRGTVRHEGATRARAEVPELPTPAPTTGDAAKYSRSGLDRAARERIARKLDDALRGQRLYSDSQLTLRGLCRHLGENPHYVSQVINQDFGASFYDLVNAHRIEHAKAALYGAPTRSVLDIAFESGFNSKSTFNAAFRQHTGTTPSAYRRLSSAGRHSPLAAQTRSPQSQ